VNPIQSKLTTQIINQKLTTASKKATQIKKLSRTETKATQEMQTHRFLEWKNKACLE
jgi:hypothetical protein